MNEYIEIKPSQGKGQGVFALKAIPRGAVVIRESPALLFYKSAEHVTDSDVQNAFERLSRTDQERLLTLNEDFKTMRKTRLLRIFRNNAFGDPKRQTSSLYLTRSRINHSCIPNASTREGTVIAEKDIVKGEEIFITYAEQQYELMTARQRAVYMQRAYGFQCSCETCSDPNIRPLSDLRRQLINRLVHALDGKQPIDFSPMNRMHADGLTGLNLPVPPSLPKPISPAQRVEYTYLLANLRQAEKMAEVTIARTYSEAAQRLLDYLNFSGTIANIQDTLLLEPARLVRTWMLKALEIAKSVMPSDDKDLSNLKTSWENMKKHSLLVVIDHLPATAFAVQMDESGPVPRPGPMLSKDQYEDIIRQRLGSRK